MARRRGGTQRTKGRAMGREDYSSRGGRMTTVIVSIVLVLAASLLIGTNALLWVTIIRWVAGK